MSLRAELEHEARMVEHYHEELKRRTLPVARAWAKVNLERHRRKMVEIEGEL